LPGLPLASGSSMMVGYPSVYKLHFKKELNYGLL
jgi:hypothetical protein